MSRILARIRDEQIVEQGKNPSSYRDRRSTNNGEGRTPAAINAFRNKAAQHAGKVLGTHYEEDGVSVAVNMRPSDIRYHRQSQQGHVSSGNPAQTPEGSLPEVTAVAAQQHDSDQQ